MEEKTCSTCKMNKPLAEYHLKNRSTGLRVSICKPCTKLASKNHYLRHKTDYKRRAKIWRDKRRSDLRPRIEQYLTEHPCVDCGEQDTVVLQFDHVRGEKTMSVSVMISRGVDWEIIRAEIDKCDVRCANCHLRKTAIQLGWDKKPWY